MTMSDRYVSPLEDGVWKFHGAGASRFTWEYDEGHDRLLSLYQKGKDKQWDAQKRVDWDQEVDPVNAVGLPEQLNPLFGSDIWAKLNQRERDEFTRHQGSWLFSQFLHGEQGAMTVAAHIVASVPSIDSKFYASTQTMDEARHVELYSRFLQEKIGMFYPINQDLASLLQASLSDSRWDLPYIGMQVLIEGLALAAFGVYRQMSTNPLVKQLLAYTMQDEARHVAFGRIVLKDLYKDITEKEREEREEFIIQGCYLMRDRFRGQEIYDVLGLPVEECMEYVENSEMYGLYQSMLFSRIVPVVKDIGLWGPKVQDTFREMGVLDAAKSDLNALMAEDEAIAERLDRDRTERELVVRRREVEDAIALGAE